MRTRNLVCVLKDGEFRVAQYGQWDGYPSGQGQSIVEFLLNDYEPVKFREQIDTVKHLTEEEIDARWAEKSKKMNFHLSRDCGAKILSYIQNTPNPEIFMNLEFASDGLFCEFAYVVNLDTNELEIFNGFGRERLNENERFYFLQAKADEDNAKKEEEGYSSTAYMPVNIIASIPFSELTLTSMEELETKLAEAAESEDLFAE